MVILSTIFKLISLLSEFSLINCEKLLLLVTIIGVITVDLVSTEISIF